MSDDTHLQPLLDDLLQICSASVWKTAAEETSSSARKSGKKAGMRGDRQIELVVPEPYVPHLPSTRPAVLVLAESQNLSATNLDYVHGLKALSPSGRFRRLIDGRANVVAKGKGDPVPAPAPPGDVELGIQPWDDGTLKFAVRAALGVDPASVAVSNAIPWSWVAGNANERPFTASVIKESARFWGAILARMSPERIVVAGAVAREVVRQALSERKDLQTNPEIIEWVLPSPRLGAAGRMFDPADLMERFEIDASVQEAVMATDESLRARQAVYVCHAVSQSRGSRQA